MVTLTHLSILEFADKLVLKYPNFAAMLCCWCVCVCVEGSVQGQVGQGGGKTKNSVSGGCVANDN